jgi:hypothetical protein
MNAPTKTDNNKAIEDSLKKSKAVTQANLSASG